MTAWVRYTHKGKTSFGSLNGETIQIHQGNLFQTPAATEQTLALKDVTLLPPCEPGKMLGLWNNFHQRAEKEGLTRPDHPLYFVLVSSCHLASGQPIRRPAGYSGSVVFEGELGIVVGKTCRGITTDEADNFIFGYTCVNDVTARDTLKADPSFHQWTRAKCHDTFGVFGPAIVTGIEPDELVVRTLVNGEEKQNYPVSDMFYRPREIVSRISQDMTLYPGDVIACGTSIGAEPMPDGCTVEIVIEGVGTLQNIFQSA